MIFFFFCPRIRFVDRIVNRPETERYDTGKMNPAGIEFLMI